MAQKRGLDILILKDDVTTIANGIQLDEKYKDHALKGNWDGFRECHLQPDWLLVYLLEDDILTLTLIDTGTYADLFKI